MNNQFIKAVIAGIVGTIAMTLMMTIGAQLGMPKMEPPKMLASVMNAPMPVGFLMHFMIGIVFALMYTFIFRNWLTKISSVLGKGVVFGIITIVLAQIGQGIMGMIFPDMPEPSGSMILIMLGFVMGHLLFGIVVTQVIHRNSK